MSPMCLQAYDIWDPMSALLRATHGGATIRLYPGLCLHPSTMNFMLDYSFVCFPEEEMDSCLRPQQIHAGLLNTSKPVSVSRSGPAHSASWPMWGWILPSV